MEGKKRDANGKRREPSRKECEWRTRRERKGMERGYERNKARREKDKKKTFSVSLVSDGCSLFLLLQLRFFLLARCLKFTCLVTDTVADTLKPSAVSKTFTCLITHHRRS